MATLGRPFVRIDLDRAANVSCEARVSIAFFASPQGAAVIQCLETCQSPTNPSRYPSVTAGEYKVTDGASGPNRASRHIPKNGQPNAR